MTMGTATAIPMIMPVLLLLPEELSVESALTPLVDTLDEVKSTPLTVVPLIPEEIRVA